MILVADDPHFTIRARRMSRRAAWVVSQGARSIAHALATPLVPGDFLDLVSPLRRGAELRGRVVAVQRHHGAATVTIQPGRGWRPHRAGQYTRIGIEVDGVRVWRAYSITSPIDAARLTITIREIPDGIVSTHAVSVLRPGTMLLLDQAAGDFVLPDPLPDKALFLTAGSGITPIIGMLRNHRLADAVVVHSSPHRHDMLFLDELTGWHQQGRIRLITRFTDDPGPGRLDVRSIGDLVPDWCERPTWACGPTGLLDDAEAHWRAEGVAEALHTERFRPHLTVVGDGGDVTFSPTGITVSADAATPLLDVGEDAGVLMPSGCRMGICFNCVVSLLDGAVRDLRTGEVTQASDHPPLIQTCVSAAAGPCHLDLKGQT